ncbi:MAG: hypothetical protein V4858_02845 [Pseudomonadota bacterium]
MPGFLIVGRRKIFFFLALSVTLSACGAKHHATHASFVGKWKSSKLETPLVLFDNGEWEIKNDDGGVLQYGIWEYRNGNIIWSFKSGGQIIQDVNAVVSATDQEFRLQEGKQVTVFKRLD